MAFIDANRDRFGVEPICRVLTEHGCKKRPLCARRVRDGELKTEIRRV